MKVSLCLLVNCWLKPEQVLSSARRQQELEQMIGSLLETSEMSELCNRKARSLFVVSVIASNHFLQLTLLI